MGAVLCLQCEGCGRLATMDLKWEKALDNPEGEVLKCLCGRNGWKLIDRKDKDVPEGAMIVSGMQFKED